MKILVIGGAGYIGSHQTRMLCDLGHDVVVFDNLSTGYIQAVDNRSLFIQGDLCNIEDITYCLENHRFDSIIHFAAFSLVGESMKDPLAYYHNNVFGMENLLNAMVKTKHDKIVFSSTAATYGLANVDKITEDTPTNPINTYGETKLAMEKMISWVNKAHGVNYVALRYFNVCGANNSGEIGEAHDPETHLIPIILDAALGLRDAITVYGDDYNTPDKTCIRDYIHVEDIASAHICAVEYLMASKPSDVFNLAYGHGYSVLEIIDSVKKVSGKDFKVEIGARRAGDPDELVASNQKAIEQLNWIPKHDNIDEIIATALKFKMSHPHGYE